MSVLCWWTAETSSGQTWVMMHPISAPIAAVVEFREGMPICCIYCAWPLKGWLLLPEGHFQDGMTILQHTTGMALSSR